ncbi:MAG: sulfatase-like hydrolase/transferase [Polyangiaceae bacterium]
MQKIRRDALFYGLALAVGALLLSAASFVLVRTSYAGVSDESAVSAGVAAYPEYLASVARAAFALTCGEVLVVFAVTSGLVVLLPAVVRGWSEGNGIATFARWGAVAMLVHALWLGAEAHRHPGLFLHLLSAVSLAPAWLAMAKVLWPAVILVSVFGWARFAVAATRGSAAALGALGAIAGTAWLAVFELQGVDLSARHASRDETSGSAKTTPPAKGRRPNVLILGVDSLRPDKIDPETTPTIAKLVAESIYFPNVLVTLPRTAPSWAALLTSLPPLANGVETMFPTQARSDLGKVALPGHLASLGYSTTVVSEYAGESFGRVKFGFQKQLVPRVELEQILGQGLLGRAPLALGFAGQLHTGPRALGRALPAPLPALLRGLVSFSHPKLLAPELLEAIDVEPPWLGLVFYSQPHFPYTSSGAYHGKYTAPDADVALRFGKDVTHGDVRTDADRAQIDGLYRGALAETDAAIADLLARLGASGNLDDTIVILTADHGEALYECDACVGHGDNLVGMTSLRVPLAFHLPRGRFPSAAAARIPAYASQLDVYPTVLSLLDVEPSMIQEGRALLTRDGALLPMSEERIFFAETGEWLWPTPAVPAQRIEYPPITVMARIEDDGRIAIDESFLPVVRAAKQRAAILPPWKLVYAPSPKGVAWRLYDFEKDPREERDLFAARPDVAERLRAALRHEVLRFSQMLPEGDFFLTRPPALPEEYY